MRDRTTRTALMNQPFWWAAFVGATVLLSLVFQAFRDFTLVPDVSNGAKLIIASLLLVAVMMVLVVDGYLKERAKGKLQRHVAWIEHMFPEAPPYSADQQGETQA